jgi:hypothetical protein
VHDETQAPTEPPVSTTTATTTEAPIDVFGDDLKSFHFRFSSDFTRRSQEADATPNRPHLGPKADSFGQMWVDLEGRQLRLKGSGQASIGIPNVESEIIVKEEDGRYQFWARTSLPDPDSFERCWHGEAPLPPGHASGRPVNPFARSVAAGMKPAEEKGDRYELQLSDQRRVRFSIADRSQLLSVLFQDAGKHGDDQVDVVVSVSQWSTGKLEAGVFDPPNLECNDLHQLQGHEGRKWLESWALLQVFMPGSADTQRLLQDEPIQQLEI